MADDWLVRDRDAEDEARDRGLSEEERRMLAGVDRAISGAKELKRWWREIDAAGAYADRFDLSSTHNRSAVGFGFFGEAPVAGAQLPVMGSVQEQFYDRPKRLDGSALAREQTADWMNRQIREFALRYFLRVSDFSQSQAFPGKNGQAPPAYLRPFSWSSYVEGGEHAGFGFEQVFYKLRGDHEPQRFAADERHAIVDLREIGKTYEWIVVKVDAFDFKFVLAPFGQRYPHGAMPASEPSYLVLSREFVIDQENPEGSDDLGRYGYGCAFLPAADESFLAHGLGRFEAAFQTIYFRVGQSGEVSSRMVFVANRPKNVVKLSFDPVDWGFRMAERFSFGPASAVIEPMQKMWHRMPAAGGLDLMQAFFTAANMVTAGGAERSLGVSRKQLHKSFLVAQFAQHCNAVAGSLAAWRQVQDWTDRENLPDWVVSGKNV